MTPKMMIWTSVVLSALAQIFLKRGLSSLQKKLGSRKGLFGLAFGIATQPFIWMWLLSFVAATGLWLLGLQKLELSYAYPLVSFGYVLVNLLSWMLFQEKVDRNRWTAVAVISLGVWMIAGS
jgi:drug/metabolite transporter (DMT)-like permease